MPAILSKQRDQKARGQHPQEVRRGCKGLKPQQLTQGPLLHGFQSLEQTFQLALKLFLCLGFKIFFRSFDLGFDFLLDYFANHRAIIQGVFQIGERTADT
jgi:hypothetical protein